MTATTAKQLVVLLAGARAGLLTEDERGRLSFGYDQRWQQSLTSMPVSLSMPLSVPTHTDRVVRAFLRGLLPNNERVLERWARTYQVSDRNPFALLTHVGEDCAGAVQLVPPDRDDAIASGKGDVEWVDDEEIARRLRALRRDPAAWRLARAGQFSLAGAQAKTALHFDPVERRWGDAWGAVPSTHILKPAVTGLDDHDLNEHLCLEAARLSGLTAAHSRVMAFGDERAIVIERYDRVRTPSGKTARVHQEDMCQAIGVPPSEKYQSDGGPSPEAIIGLLRRVVAPPSAATDDVTRFVDALAFNWIIAGTDAHAKNYSLLLAPGQTRLAPLYDIASALPYDDMYLPRLAMAMWIGREYRVETITGRHWRRFAVANSLDPDRTIEQVRNLATRLPARFAEVSGAEPVRALASDLPDRLVDRVTERARRCLNALGVT